MKVLMIVRSSIKSKNRILEVPKKDTGKVFEVFWDNDVLKCCLGSSGVYIPYRGDEKPQVVIMENVDDPRVYGGGRQLRACEAEIRKFHPDAVFANLP